MIESVDYDQRFASQTHTEPLTIDEDLLVLFDDIYDSLISGQTDRSRELIPALREIHRSLIENAEDEFQRQFITELFRDLERLISEQIEYFLSCFEPKRKFSETFLDRGEFKITNISSSALKKILEIHQPVVSELRKNAEKGFLRREDLSVNSGKIVRRICRVLNKEFRQSGVLQVLQYLIPGRPKVVGVAIELSAAGSTWWQTRGESSHWPQTMYAHVDRGIDAPKAILYLTDVGEHNGATSCYPSAYQKITKNWLQDLVGRSLETIGRDPNSPLYEYYSLSGEGQPLQNPKFLEHFVSLPKSLRFNSHFGWDVIPGSHLEEFLTHTEQKIIGPAGTCFVFDGSQLLHRGGLILEGERVVLQIVFGNRTIVMNIVRTVRYAFSKVKRK